MLNKTVFIWGENESLPNQPAPPPTVSVSAWPYLFDQTWLRWDTRDIRNMPEEARTAEVAFVNLFHTPDSIHIQQLREVNPSCWIVAMPDPCLDLVLSHPEWMNMWRQMVLADCIGGRTTADCSIYGTLLNKPTEYLPSPIGPTDWFAQFRTKFEDKEDFVLTLDHSFGQTITAPNVAACAVIQREFGLRVIYVAARDHTPELAKLAGLKAQFTGPLPFQDFVALTGRAKLCVDMYASHSYGRQQVLCGMLGTPIIGSQYCGDAPGYKLDIFHLEGIVADVRELLKSPAINSDGFPANMLYTERYFGLETSKARLTFILEKRQVRA